MGTEFVLAMELFTSASIQRIQGRAGELYLGARLYCGPIPSSSPSKHFQPGRVARNGRYSRPYENEKTKRGETEEGL